MNHTHSVTYPVRPERLIALRAMEESDLRELVDELRAKFQARKALAQAACEARDLLAQIPLIEKGVAIREAARVHAMLDAALKACEG